MQVDLDLLLGPPLEHYAPDSPLDLDLLLGPPLVDDQRAALEQPLALQQPAEQPLVLQQLADHDDEHIFLAAPLAIADRVPEKHVQRSSKLLEFARSELRFIRSHRREAVLKAEAAASSAALDLVVASVPAVAKLVGRNKSGTNIGRAKHVQPSSFKLLSRAIHMPLKSRLHLGISHHRFLCAGAKLILNRQREGLSRLLHRSEESLSLPVAGLQRKVHLTYWHMWDEVSCKFRRFASKRFRSNRMAQHQQTIMQRGALVTTMVDLQADAMTHHSEYLVCQPQQVASTDAASLWPAIFASMPAEFSIEHLDRLTDCLKQVSSLTIGWLGDKASGNLLLMKRFCHMWETHLLPSIGPKLLVLPETCGVHVHHRSKLQLKPLRFHTYRHFSLVNLYRLQSVQDSMIRLLEHEVPRRVQRRLGPPPADIRCTLQDVVNVMFKPHSPTMRVHMAKSPSRWKTWPPCAR